MSDFIEWVIINTDARQRVPFDDVDASEEAGVIDRCLLPITRGERGRAGRGSMYSVSGEIGGKRALLRLWEQSAVVADVAVCLHSRAAPGLWADVGGSDDAYPNAAPWVAMRLHAALEALPAWFASWTKTLAVALARREGW